MWRKSGMSTHLQLAEVVQTLDSDYTHYSHYRWSLSDKYCIQGSWLRYPLDRDYLVDSIIHTLNKWGFPVLCKLSKISLS